jgi:hypothetical protein
VHDSGLGDGGTRATGQRALKGDQLLVAPGKVRRRPDLRMQHRLGLAEQLRKVRREALLPAWLHGCQQDIAQHIAAGR